MCLINSPNMSKTLKNSHFTFFLLTEARCIVLIQLIATKITNEHI